MTGDPPFDPTLPSVRWLSDRLDQTDERVGRRIDELAVEVRTTRHAQRETITQLTQQVVQLVGQAQVLERDIKVVQNWQDGARDKVASLARDVDAVARELGELKDWRESAQDKVTRIGTFTWADVYRFVGAVAASVAIVGLWR